VLKKKKKEKRKKENKITANKEQQQQQKTRCFAGGVKPPSRRQGALHRFSVGRRRARLNFRSLCAALPAAGGSKGELLPAPGSRGMAGAGPGVMHTE
jgi:hypothetical protein